MVHSTGVRGPTLVQIDTVSVWQSCGKPSTKFPHGGLVECLSISEPFQIPLLIREIFKTLKITIFLKTFIFWN